MFQGCDKAHQSPPGALSACAPFLPISVLPAAALPLLSLLAPLLHERLSGKLHRPGTKVRVELKKKYKKGNNWHTVSVYTYLLHLMPGLLKLFDLPLGLIQLSEKAGHISTGGCGG